MDSRHGNSGSRPLSVPWAITFADLALLLLCFFVMLTSFSSRPSPVSAAPVANSTAESRGSNSQSKVIGTMLQQNFSSEIAKGWLFVDASAERLRIQFGASEGFESGSDALTSQTVSLIDAMGPMLAEGTAKISVIGHTDDLPIHTERFRDNWELSSARAVSVIRELINRYGVDPSRLEAKSYADTHPVATNDSEANRARNRRIEIEISWAR